MARLSVRVLGQFQVSLDEEPVSGFASDKVRALLAYLVSSPERPHRREVLAGLLWPEFPERSARTNLRNALANLRRVIRDRDASPPFLHSTRQTVQFNGQSDYWLDADAFEVLIATTPPVSENLEQAVGLVRGLFLEGFSLADAAPFEEWLLLRRERFGRQVVKALGSLAAIYEGHGAYEHALRHARRRVELEPWQEDGQRQFMRLLALGGHRSEALAQYEKLCRSLQEELGAEPAQETTKLYEQIRDETLKAPLLFPVRPPNLAVEPPPFLDEEPVEAERPVFVARERELAQLDRFLDLALAGQARVVFVTGEAGSGKTALVQEFTRRAQDANADLIVASGSCNAYTGIGDPYLPFREILELLTGDVEAKWAARAITSEDARRLWHRLPVAVRALVEIGPELIDTFIPRTALLERAMTHRQWPGEADWLSCPDDLVEPWLLGLTRDAATSSGVPALQQRPLFKQYTAVLKAVARMAPLVLVVDDLQWADTGSISLLFHLGRQLAGSPILIVGAYRSEDVALGRDGLRHPLEPVVHELQREFGDVTVNVDQAEHRGFVEALLDSQPQRLGVAFRDMLYRQTHGHPLFTIELLRALQEQGDLVQDSEGCWVEGEALDWQTLPARVEAVIAERIARLPEPLQAALRVASVEGEVFTAEVVARVRADDQGEVVRSLSGELDRRHRLVRAQGLLRSDGQRVCRYRFRHILFQRYLYNGLDKVERAQLHEAVGNALEALYEGLTEALAPAAAIAPQLAWHFEEAGIAQKAMLYLRQAGERAVQLCAYQEAIAHLTRALATLMALPDSGTEGQRLERAQQELALQLALGIAWRGAKGYGPEAERAYTRARELCEQTGDTSQHCQVLGKLSIFHFVRARHRKARKFAEEALSLAQQAEDPLHIALGHWYLGFVLLSMGEYTAARARLEQMIAFYEPQRHHRSLVLLRGSDAGLCALAQNACCLWCLGYPEQASNQGRKALALAREFGHPMSLLEVLYFAGCLLNRMCRDAQALKDDAEELMVLAEEKALAWLGGGVSALGEALVMLGQVQEGMVKLRAGIAAGRSIGGLRHLPGRLLSLAEAQAKSGHPEEGLLTLAEALALVEETDERHWEAELHRLRAELLLMQGAEDVAETSFQKAIEVARLQQARSWELRATTSLARRWQKQGRTREARELLAQIYGWFTEGFDTPDLQEARALLEELA
jgi:DNA-binding SARP family transcriptional activator/predicted ATPase